MLRKYVDDLIILNESRYCPILEFSKFSNKSYLFSILQYLNSLFKFFTFQFIFFNDYNLPQEKVLVYG